ncbi:MAG: PEP-utilizing enzyme [Candidatus Paceibacterota bacterium]|jgi:phosphohistidine swiveling domain-containing protein
MSDIFDKYEWKALAGDFNSPFIRNYIWTKGIYDYKKLFGISRPVLGIVSRENNIEYIGDLSTWTKSHEELKKMTEEDNSFVEKLIDTTNRLGEEFNAWSEENIFRADLAGADDKALIKLFEDFVSKQGDMYAYGTTLPILDFGNFSFVEGNLKKILETKLPESEYQRYFEILTEPLHNSFAQDQEEDLLRLMSVFYEDESWRNDVVKDSLPILKSKYPAFYEKLQDHTAKHAWVYYQFLGPAYKETDFLSFIRDYSAKGIDPKKKLEELRDKAGETARLRTQYIKDLKPNDFEKMILHLVGKLVWAKPRRKDYQSKSYYHLEKLLSEIARRLSLSLSQARSFSPDYLKESLGKGGADPNALNSIYKFHVCLPKEDGGVLVLSGAEAKGFSDTYVKREVVENLAGIEEIHGQVAYRGRVSGKVKVINLPSDMEKMEEGDILVSLATSPSLVPAMKKAMAIVTDEGGLTCHASIVSRELGITCIVGTKFASKVLKDGDMVEVDAEKGVVRILK